MKEKLKELKALRDKVTRSDLQGIVTYEVIKMVGKTKKNYMLEEIFLLYIDNEMDLNSANRFLLGILNKMEVENGRNKIR